MRLGLRSTARRAVLGLAFPALATAQPVPPPTLAALERELGAVTVTTSPATGRIRFLRLRDRAGAAAAVGGAHDAAGIATGFVGRWGILFGLRDPGRELLLERVERDPEGITHVRYQQVHRGVPVFAGGVRIHVDPEGRVTAAHGTVVPVDEVEPEPSLPASAARAVVTALATPGAHPSLEEPRLVVYAVALTWGLPGPGRLAWQVDTTGLGGDAPRERVFVDAGSGAVIDRLPRAGHLLDRRLHLRTAADPPAWREGDARPVTASPSAPVNAAAERVLDATAGVYRFFANLTGGTHLSYDGRSAPMTAVVDAAALDGRCPNASWDGSSVNLCLDTAVDDVVAHEWVHAYTDATDDLIYRWQPGALNESASDVLGETLDLLNRTGTDSPMPRRADGACSALAASTLPELSVLAPPALAGDLRPGTARFGGGLSPHKLVADLVAAVDEFDGPGYSNRDACAPLLDPASVRGRIALVDRGWCTFAVKARHVQDAGAVGMVVANNTSDAVFTMDGADPGIGIPLASVGRADGNRFRDALDAGPVRVALGRAAATDVSLRWLIGEDPAGTGASFRDLWRPSCLGLADRKTDPLYFCPLTASADYGGVHRNSGVPSHTFALLADGGTFNGRTVRGVGFTKAVHILWRAKTHYQTPISDFTDHADSLELACADLAQARTNLPGLMRARRSGQVVTAEDCRQLAAAIAATELRQANPCPYRPILAPDPPDGCGGGTPQPVFVETFDQGAPGWTSSAFARRAEDRPAPWESAAALPQRRPGSAYFARREHNWPACLAWIDELRPQLKVLESPPIVLPGAVEAPRLAFDHWVTTSLRDGANLKISVNGGAYSVVPATAFLFNGYNGQMYAGAEAYDAREPAWFSTDQGAVTGSWGRSQVDLGGLAGPGDTIRLRFDYAYQACDWEGVLPRAGWMLDDVEVYDCPTAPGGGGESSRAQ